MSTVNVNEQAGISVSVNETGEVNVTVSQGSVTINGSVSGITALTGDVTASGTGSVVATIASNAVTSAKIIDAAVTNAKLTDMTQSTVKGRAAGAGTGDPQDLTATQATALLNVVVGDSGAGGTKGLVPAPAAGDTAAGRFLKADGTFATPAGTALPAGGFGDIQVCDGTTSFAVLTPHSTTGVTGIFAVGIGSTVLEDDTFNGGIGTTGFTIGDIVAALKIAKILID